MRIGLVGGTRAEKNKISMLLPPSMTILWHAITRAVPMAPTDYRTVDVLVVIPTLSTHSLMELAEAISLRMDCKVVLFTYQDLGWCVNLLTGSHAQAATDTAEPLRQLEACEWLNLPRHLGCGMLRRNVPAWHGSAVLAYKVVDLETYRARMSLRDLRIAEREYNNKRVAAEAYRKQAAQLLPPVIGAVLKDAEEAFTEPFFPTPIEQPATEETARSEPTNMVLSRWPVLVGPTNETRQLKGHIWVREGATDDELLDGLQKYLQETGSNVATVYTVCRPVLSVAYSVQPVLKRL